MAEEAVYGERTCGIERQSFVFARGNEYRDLHVHAVFFYPRFLRREINPLLFQATVVVMGVATFSFVFANLYYYSSSLGGRIDDAERALDCRRGDRFCLLGYTLLFLGPSLILFTVGLLAVGSARFALWLVYVLFVIRYFPRVQTVRKSS